MPEEVVYYVTRYGYLAIFILVFLQEIGMPNPFPNELLLMFTGYLSFKGLLFLPFILITVIAADFIGTNILYIIFYNTGTILIRKKPSWFPLSARIIEQLTNKISVGGKWTIFIFRLTPFTRGYTSVITGLLQVKPKIFLPVSLISAIIWASIYILIGHLIGPYWDMLIQNIAGFKFIMLALLVVVLCMFLIVYFNRKRERHKAKAGINNSFTD